MCPARHLFFICLPKSVFSSCLKEAFDLSSKASFPFIKFDHRNKVARIWQRVLDSDLPLQRSRISWKCWIGGATMRMICDTLAWKTGSDVTSPFLYCHSLQSRHLLRVFLGNSAWMNGKMWFSQPCKKTKKKSQHIYILVHGHMD